MPFETDIAVGLIKTRHDNYVNRLFNIFTWLLPVTCTLARQYASEICKMLLLFGLFCICSYCGLYGYPLHGFTAECTFVCYRFMHIVSVCWSFSWPCRCIGLGTFFLFCNFWVENLCQRINFCFYVNADTNCPHKASVSRKSAILVFVLSSYVNMSWLEPYAL